MHRYSNLLYIIVSNLKLVIYHSIVGNLNKKSGKVCFQQHDRDLLFEYVRHER